MCMGTPQLTPEQLSALLTFASTRLGISKEALAQTVQSGDISALGLSAENNKKLEALLGDREQTQSLLQSPQVQQALSKLLGGKKTDG